MVRLSGRLIGLLTAASLLAGCASGSSPGAGGSPGAASPAPDPPGWTRVTSPKLGYSLALPTGWSVQPPYKLDPPMDEYLRYLPGEENTEPPALFVVAGPLHDPPPSFKPDVPTEEVIVDGQPFVMAGMTGSNGDTQLTAIGVVGDKDWTIAALGAPADVDRDFFVQVLATFTFPAPDFEALVCAGGTAPFSLSGTDSTTQAYCEVSDGRYAVEWEADGSCDFTVRFFDGGAVDATVVDATISGEAKQGTEITSLPNNLYSLFIEADGCSWTVGIAGTQ